MDDAASLYRYLKGDAKRSPLARRAPGASPPVPGFMHFVQTGEFSYRRVARAPNPLSRWGAEEPLLSARERAADLLFFDTETTGLSGGAGNLAFLLGAGYLDGNELVVEQHFLADFPGEPEFLEIIRPLFAAGRTCVSYNGSAFDSHLLVTRFRLNRMDFAPGRQYDLLHPARRLWKKGLGDMPGGCSLKNVERFVLGADRGEDIDGAEVPEYYFRFLRSRDTAALEPVFRHNHIDVLSLASLLHRIESLLREPEALLGFAAGTAASAAAGERPVLTDPAALGMMLLERDPERAEPFLERELALGEAACGRALGFHLKRRREYDRAGRVWERLFQNPLDVLAGIELAMHLEHRLRDARRALEVVTSLLEAPGGPDSRLRRDLEKRRARLERKLHGLGSLKKHH